MEDRAPDQPLRRLVAAKDVPAEGMDVVVEADAAERDTLAGQLGLLAIHRLVGRFSVKGSTERLSVTGEAEAVVRQLCVVSLEPFDSEMRESVTVTFAESHRVGGAASARGPVERTPDRDPPDDIVDGGIDLGALTAECLALGLDPYPRKPGAVFVHTNDTDDGGRSPFAELKRLKSDDSHKA